jgi:hypothetical protein
MDGALCMALITKDEWSPINDIESVIVSVRSLLFVGDGRLEAAFILTETKYNALLADTKSRLARTTTLIPTKLLATTLAATMLTIPLSSTNERTRKEKQ